MSNQSGVESSKKSPKSTFSSNPSRLTNPLVFPVQNTDNLTDRYYLGKEFSYQCTVKLPSMLPVR